MADISKIKVDEIEYDVKDAVARAIASKSLNYITTVGSDKYAVDLNTLTGNGIYKITFHTVSEQTANNSPIDYGTLVVFSSDGYVAQVAFGHPSVLYIRTATITANTWHPWKKVTLSEV